MLLYAKIMVVMDTAKDMDNRLKAIDMANEVLKEKGSEFLAERFLNEHINIVDILKARGIKPEFIDSTVRYNRSKLEVEKNKITSYELYSAYEHYPEFKDNRIFSNTYFNVSLLLKEMKIDMFLFDKYVREHLVEKFKNYYTIESLYEYYKSGKFKEVYDILIKNNPDASKDKEFLVQMYALGINVDYDIDIPLNVDEEEPVDNEQPNGNKETVKEETEPIPVETKNKKDCKTTMGQKVKITESNADDYFGRYYIENGEDILIVDPMGKYGDSLLNKTVHIRTPLFCKNGTSDACVICTGDKELANKQLLKLKEEFEEEPEDESPIEPEPIQEELDDTSISDDAVEDVNESEDDSSDGDIEQQNTTKRSYNSKIVMDDKPFKEGNRSITLIAVSKFIQGTINAKELYNEALEIFKDMKFSDPDEQVKQLPLKTSDIVEHYNNKYGLNKVSANKALVGVPRVKRSLILLTTLINSQESLALHGSVNITDEFMLALKTDLNSVKVIDKKETPSLENRSSVTQQSKISDVEYSPVNTIYVEEHISMYKDGEIGIFELYDKAKEDLEAMDVEDLDVALKSIGVSTSDIVNGMIARDSKVKASNRAITTITKYIARKALFGMEVFSNDLGKRSLYYLHKQADDIVKGNKTKLPSDYISAIARDFKSWKLSKKVKALPQPAQE
jgi:hypothetical protein